MRYVATADTDIGISKDTNQDSVLIKHASTDKGEVLLAVVCDGMGGLSKGELASATVIRAFADWFDNELPFELKNVDLNVIGAKWSLMLKELNAQILEYSKSNALEGVGTTFSGILFVDDQYIIGHVGDTRVYHIGSALTQLTTDQTFIAREISRGTITLEQAKTDKRRASYYEYYSSKKWGSVDSYHFCIDSSYLGLGRTVELIQTMVAHKEHPIPSPTEEDPTRPRT